MATQTVTFERNGKTFELKDPEGMPTDKQLFIIGRMLHEDGELKAPKFPRTKAEASSIISKLKS